MNPNTGRNLKGVVLGALLALAGFASQAEAGGASRWVIGASTPTLAYTNPFAGTGTFYGVDWGTCPVNTANWVVVHDSATTAGFTAGDHDTRTNLLFVASPSSSTSSNYATNSLKGSGENVGYNVLAGLVALRSGTCTAILRFLAN